MLNEENSLILVIDIQEKLVNALENKDIVKNSLKVIKAGNILDIPILATEQYPKGLGKTVFGIQELLKDSPIEKTSFDALLEEDILKVIKESGKKQILIMGIETHICVYQTACALIDEGYEVYVITDACASRKKYEFKQGIETMKQHGVKVTCVEIVLFEWLKSAKHPKFKEIQSLIK